MAESMWEVVGRNVRRLRLRENLRQEDLTALLNKYGLMWAPTAVPALESGKRQLDLGELALLCAALNIRPVELLEGDGIVAVVGRTEARTEARLDAIRSVIAGGLPKFQPGRHGFRPHDPAQSFIESLEEEPDPRWSTWWPQLDGYDPSAEDDPRFPYVLQASLVTGGSAERNAARALGVRPIDVSVAAHGLWGRSLTRQRDLVIGGSDGELEISRSLQSRRGRVTRKLIEELRSHMGLGDDRSERPPH